MMCRWEHEQKDGTTSGRGAGQQQKEENRWAQEHRVGRRERARRKGVGQYWSCVGIEAMRSLCHEEYLQPARATQRSLT
eukprot:3415425-Rhodomonas_salina.2